MQINEKFPIFSNVSSFVFFNTTIGVLCVRIHLVKFDWGDWKKNPEDRWTTTITQEANTPDTTMTQWKKKRKKPGTTKKQAAWQPTNSEEDEFPIFICLFSGASTPSLFTERLTVYGRRKCHVFRPFSLVFRFVGFFSLSTHGIFVLGCRRHTQQLPSRLYSSPIPSFVGFNSSRNEK